MEKAAGLELLCCTYTKKNVDSGPNPAGPGAFCLMASKPGSKDGQTLSRAINI